MWRLLNRNTTCHSLCELISWSVRRLDFVSVLHLLWLSIFLLPLQQFSLIPKGKDLMEASHFGLSPKDSVHCLAVDHCIYSHLLQQEMYLMTSNREYNIRSLVVILWLCSTSGRKSYCISFSPKPLVTLSHVLYHQSIEGNRFLFMEWTLNPIGYCLLPLDLWHHVTLAAYSQFIIGGQRICSWLGFHLSPLVACQEPYSTMNSNQ